MDDANNSATLVGDGKTVATDLSQVVATDDGTTPLWVRRGMRRIARMLSRTATVCTALALASACAGYAVVAARASTGGAPTRYNGACAHGENRTTFKHFIITGYNYVDFP